MRALRAIAGAALAAAVLLVATAAPAAAHDELIASDPTAGQALDTAPANVQLTFSAELLTIGAAVLVVDDSGRDWVDGEPAIQGNVVTAPLQSGMPASGYEIRWRAVSSDGHPISGIVPFSVANGAPPAEPSATPTDGSTPTATAVSATVSDAAGPDSAGSDSAGSESGNSGPLRLLLVGLGGAAAAVAVLLIVRSQRARSGSSGGPRS